MFRAAILISLTAHLITFPLSVDKIISSPSFTGKDAATFPFLEDATMPIISIQYYTFIVLIVPIQKVCGLGYIFQSNFRNLGKRC